MKEVERLKEVEAAVNAQTMEFLEKKRNQLQDEVDAWEERQAMSVAVVDGAAAAITEPGGRIVMKRWCWSCVCVC